MFSEEDMVRAEQALEQVYHDWLQRPGVTAVDLGFKWTDGHMTDQLAIRVHVHEKRPLAEIPESQIFPSTIDGVPVDVLQATYGIQSQPDSGSQLEAAAGNREDRFAEIPLGVSIGCPHVSAGTLGAKVYDIASGSAMILSNWHVLAAIPTAAAGLPIWQPGALDGGRSDANTFAILDRFNLGPYDAAVARITGSRPVLNKTIEGDVIDTAAAPRLGMRVRKSGRTSGLTFGFIDGVRMTTTINYGAAGTRTLQNVVRIVPIPGTPSGEISEGGDSGSVWVDEATGKAVGLHFAGEVGDAPEHALANEIVPVLELLKVRLQPEAAAPPPPAPPTPTPLPPTPEPTRPPVPPTPPPPQLSFWQRLMQWLRGLFGG